MGSWQSDIPAPQAREAYNDAGVSDKMKALNRKFGMLHGWSSLLNLDTAIALILHGLRIGRYGLYVPARVATRNEYAAGGKSNRTLWIL